MPSQPSESPVLIYLGANAHYELECELLAIDPNVRFVESAIYPERQKSNDINVGFGDDVIQFDADLRGKDGEILFTPIADSNQIDIINSVMDDKLLPLLWTRFGGRFRWRHLSEIKRFESTYSLIKSAIHVCQKLRPRVVVFSYEPHMLPMYIFKRVCQAMGIQTYTMTISPFNWRVFLKQGNSDRTLKPLIYDATCSDDQIGRAHV